MAAPEVKYTQIFINNEWRDSISGKTFAAINPSTGLKTADIQEGDKADAELAIKAAREAVKLGSPWRRMDASERGRLMFKLAELVERDSEYIARLETLDNGMILKTTRISCKRAGGLMRYFAGWTDKIHGKTIPIDGDYFCYTRREPIGVVGAIVPWNFPIPLLFKKLAATLACGNSIVVKPAEQTPLTALYTAALCKEAGFPPGVVNIVPGFGPTAGAALSESMDVDLITFTGSVEVAKLVQQAAGRSNLKHVSIESGGKSPNIVFADSDMDFAVELSHNAIHNHSGQVCLAGSRTFVQEDIYDEFVKRSVERAKRRVVGDPYQANTESGPQIDQEGYDKVMEMIASGKQEGAKLECGGERISGKGGYFVEPTVFSNVQDDMRIAKEEIFGPVQQIIKFKTLEEVIDRANRTNFGLSAAVLTKDIDKAITIANSVQAGIVWVNAFGVVPSQAPFGGYKMSGLGREGGEDTLNEFSELKTIIVKIPGQGGISKL